VSKSIANLLASVDRGEWAQNFTISSSPGEAVNGGSKIVLNLSPLSLSASSITSASDFEQDEPKPELLARVYVTESNPSNNHNNYKNSPMCNLTSNDPILLEPLANNIAKFESLL